MYHLRLVKFIFCLFQSSQYPSKSKGEGYRQTDRYKRESSYDRARDSPSRDSPRYHNKNSYIERTKERLEKGVNFCCYLHVETVIHVQ